MNRRRQQILIWSIGLLVTAVMLFLGLWQMQAFRNQGQDAMRARMTQPAVPLETVARAGEEPGDAYGRPVTIQGRYLPEEQLLIPDPHDPQRHRILTALELADGSVLPVVRGEVTGDAAPPPPADTVRQTGLFLPTEAEPEREYPPGTLGSIRLPRIAQLWPQTLMPGYLSLNEADAAAQGMTAAAVAVPTGAGHARNSGYALQWWIFAAAAVAATVKLSRDARKGTGFMASQPQSSTDDAHSVDNSGDNRDAMVDRASNDVGNPRVSTEDRPRS